MKKSELCTFLSILVDSPIAGGKPVGGAAPTGPPLSSRWRDTMVAPHSGCCSSGRCHASHISVARVSHVAKCDITGQDAENPPAGPGSEYRSGAAAHTEPPGRPRALPRGPESLPVGAAPF